MKLLKRIMAGSLTLAVVVGACFAFTGCKLSGKSYTYAEDATVTVITKTEKDSDGKYTITETKDLTLAEYYLYTVGNKKLDELAEAKIEDEKAFELWKENFVYLADANIRNNEYAFKGNKLIETDARKNEVTGKNTRKVITEYKYEKVDDNEYLATIESEQAPGYIEISTVEFFMDADGNLCIREYNSAISSNAQLEDAADDKMVLTYNFIFSEVKD